MTFRDDARQEPNPIYGLGVFRNVLEGPEQGGERRTETQASINQLLPS
jgi:hypothetical protein